MKIEQILPFYRRLVERTTLTGDVAIDCTVGNGNDTLFLSNLVGESGQIYGFDIQEEAIASTQSKLQESDAKAPVQLFCCGHEEVESRIPEKYFGKVASAVFNLGYLPGGDKSITTNSDTTIRAIESLLRMMKREGIIVLVVYAGHPEGAIERDDLLSYCRAIPLEQAHVLEYRFTNHKQEAPFIIAIEKRA